MTTEEKQLLLKDICARLPYSTKCYCKWSKEASNGTSGYIQELSTFLLDEFEMIDNPECDCQVSEIKPYLRPMSSMTKEERTEREKFIKCIIDEKNHYRHYVVFPHDSVDYHDWLDAHHFDYRGLIPMGLALEAPEGMYND